MNRDEARKLLGGYATGTLTPAEEQALFEAALEDQELFDAMAREQSLRDLLRDPAAKAVLLAALDQPTPRWYERWRAWRPAAAALAMAAVALVAVVIVRQGRPGMQVLEVAQVRPPAPAIEEPRPEKKAQSVSALARQEPAPRSARAPHTATATATAPSLAPAPPPLPPPAVTEPAPPPPAKPVSVEVADSPRAQPAPAALASLEARLRDAEPPSAPAPGLAAPPAGQDVRSLFYGGAAGAGAAKSKTERPIAAPRSTTFGAVSGYSAGAVATANLPRMANPGVKYTVLRKSATGDFVEAAPGSLKSGDTVELRFETNDSGLLTVMARGEAGSRQVFSRRMEPLAPYTTEPLRSGETRLEVAFSRQAPAAPRAVEVTRTTLSEQAAAERSTYVVGQPASRQVTFTITLDFQ